tara:strand:+ start:1027 stop:1683 length:657 start_codon:yes stop_codon:yes gene_type:complete
MTKGFSPGEANVLEADLSGIGKGIGSYFKEKAADTMNLVTMPGRILQGEPFTQQELMSGASGLAGLVTGGGLVASNVRKGAGEALLGMNVRGKDIVPKKVLHASPNEIKGGFETSKGSTYKVYADGTTVRTKKVGEGAGVQPKADKTYYVSPEDMTTLKMSLKTSTVQLFPDKIRLNIGEGQIIDIPASTNPAVGLHPVEYVRNITLPHLGNVITKVE